MPFVQGFNYPGYETLGDVFSISAASAFTAPARIVATSGQIGNALDYHPNGEPQFTGTHEEQFEAAMHNIERSLAAASPDLSPEQLWAGVFNMTSFHVGVMTNDEQLQIGAVARKYLGKDNNKPAWAAINVLSLFPKGCLVEIQVQAAYKV